MQEIIDKIIQLDSLIGFKKLPVSMNPKQKFQFTFSYAIITQQQLELVNGLLKNQNLFDWEIILEEHKSSLWNH
jgi:hypothetical protein